MTKIGVMLAGCGVMDGSEIHESVLTLLALAREGAEAVCMAPDGEQHDVVNHLTGKPSPEKRNILVESARIARGKIKNVKEVQAKDLDGLIFPGGYGAAKNLCTFAFDGPDCKVHPEVARLAREIQESGKPIGAICIAPALIAKIFEKKSVKLTIGSEAETAGAIQKMGNQHVICSVSQTCLDESHRLVSTPAYMLAKNIAEAYEGIEKLVSEVLRLAKKPALKS